MILIFVIKIFTLVLVIFMTLKTKSKGLTLIIVTYILVTLFDYILFIGWNLRLHVHITNRISQILNSPLRILSYILYSVGVYLCYREWRQGRLTPNKMNEFN